MLVVLDMTVICPAKDVGQKIGNPSVIVTSGSATSQQTSTGISNGSAYNTNASNNDNRQNKTTAPKPMTPNNNSSISNSDDLSTHLTHPIISLTPYQNRWIIRVRVMSKSPIRTWSNAKGEGKLFSMDLMDESGEIRATAFREMVDKYYDMIQVDRVYYISRGQLKVANKQYSTLKNDYEMTFSSDTIVQECHDTVKMPEIQYNFVPIASISTMEANSVVDIMGICKEATDTQTLMLKSGRESKKREVTLVDRSGSSVRIFCPLLYKLFF